MVNMYRKEDTNKIKRYLVQRKETLAVAESVTAGHLQAAFSMADEASIFFQGGITVYNVGQKSRHLNIDPIMALACNSVSERVSAEMAIQACLLFCSDWGIGITGYATPVPELSIKTLFAIYAIAHKGKIVQRKKVICRNKTAVEAQLFYTSNVLNDFIKKLGRF